MVIARRMLLTALALALGAACGTANPTPHPGEYVDIVDAHQGDEWTIAGTEITEDDDAVTLGDAAVPGDGLAGDDGGDGGEADVGPDVEGCDDGGDAGPCPPATTEGDAQ